jgi:hypothetical protein
MIPRIRLNHPVDGGLRIVRVSPDDERIELSTSTGASGANYGSGATSCAGTKTSFNDGDATPVTAGAAPFKGVLRPEQAIANLLGGSITGTWRLQITNRSQDPGTLFCFS